jgi:putative ABC transport system permease protein
VLFADEPPGNLDSATSAGILALLRDPVSSYGQTTVMVTHDASAATIADRILFLADGRIVKELGRSQRSRRVGGHGRGERPMIRVALRGLAGRKLRAALTALAVVLGVAMVSGTYVFTDTIEKVIDTLLTDAYTGSDAVISGTDVVECSTSGDATVPAGLLSRVKELPQVEAASGGIVDYARLIDKQGVPISTHDSAIGLGVDAGEARFNPLRLTHGRWPSGVTEVAIDATTAEQEGFALGETIGVVAAGPVRRFTISGTTEFSSLDSTGDLTFAVFDVPTAQAFFGKANRFDEIYVAAKGAAEVATGEAQTKSEAEGTNNDLELVQRILLADGRQTELKTTLQVF